MKIDAIIALINHPDPSPPDDVLRAAAFEALDMVTTAVDSLKRIADAQTPHIVTSRNVVTSDALTSMPLGDAVAVMQNALLRRYGGFERISRPDGTPESVAYDALGRLLDQ